jgi:hypothetical protein
MAAKLIARKNGRFRQRGFVVASAGASSAGKPVALDASGRLSTTVAPTLPEAFTFEVLDSGSSASRRCIPGYFVYLNGYDLTLGLPKVGRAGCSDKGRLAIGWVVKTERYSGGAAGYSATHIATVKPLGTVNDKLTGLIPGQHYWLSTTALASYLNILNAPPDENNATNNGRWIQYLGVAISATELATVKSIPIRL